jgi:uncharacterized membrane protein
MNSVLRYRITLGIFFVITLSFLGFVIWGHGQLPEKVPIHFDFAGNPDRVSVKSEMTIVNLSIGILMLLCFGVGAMLIEKVPAKYINLPNRDYWLSPERRKDSLADANFYYVAIGIVSMALMWEIYRAAFQVAMNREETLSLGPFREVGYIAAILVLIVMMFLRFWRKGKGNGNA